jgi:ATP-dependent Clp protease protease subunit
MHNRKLLNLLARNAKKGEFRAESGDQGNTIYVYDVIVASDEDAAWFGGVSAESFVKALKGMSGDVTLRINSPGGDVFGAKAMAQAVREHGGKVTAQVDGYAASAASYLAVSAGSTVMAPGAMLMIHKAWTIDIGNADDFKATADMLDKIDGTIAADYAASAERRGKEAADFTALMAAETWFTPDEAIEAGLADALAEAAPKAKLDWDLSAYEHAPKPEARSGDVQLKIEFDASGIKSAIDEAVAKIRSDLGLDPDEEEDAPGTGGPDDDDEIEAEHRQRVAALGLRPAA